jgi:membrane-associated phospholipid phosphatase
MTRAVPAFKCLMAALGFLAAFATAAVLGCFREYFDRPVVQVINHLALSGGVFNRIAVGVTHPTFQGAMIVSFVWCCWFSSSTPELRVRLVRGAAAAVLAGLIAHLLHDWLSFSPKPIFDPSLEIHPLGVLGDMDILRATSHPLSPSFPSERATLFAGLAIAVCMVSRKMGSLVLGFTVAVESCRIYLGLHYPTDIIASFCLAATFVRLSEGGALFGLGSQLVKWEHASAPSFYLCGFIASYQMASAFQELRDLAKQLRF